METIRLMTWINAPVERCFKLATSIDLHIASAASSGEKAVGGVTSGLIGSGETVTWSGRHLGIRLEYTSRIDVWRPYSYFRDVMISGAFTRFEHDHHFAPMDDGTRMRDEIRFTVPWGVLGRVATKMLVRRRLTAFLIARNNEIKRVAESGEWHRYLDGRPGGVQVTKGKDELMGNWNNRNAAVSS